MPDFLAYHRSLTDELTAIQNRVRNLVNHWPTDGAFKEYVLRSVLRRHMPESLFIGTGFVVTPTACSGQIDSLIVDKARPRLFSEGDLMIVTPDAVRVAIEVKTSLDGPSKIDEAMTKLVTNHRTWVNTEHGRLSRLGLFVYNASVHHEDCILRSVHNASVQHEVGVDCVAFGSDIFVNMPYRVGEREFSGWVSRNTGGLAAASFIGNLIQRFSGVHSEGEPHAWDFPPPRDGTLRYLEGCAGATVEKIAYDSCFPSQTPSQK